LGGLSPQAPSSYAYAAHIEGDKRREDRYDHGPLDIAKVLVYRCPRATTLHGYIRNYEAVTVSESP